MFADFFGGENDSFLTGDEANSGDEKFSRHDERDEPDGQEASAEESDEGNGDEEFIGEWIEEATEVGFDFPEAGEVAVEPIGESGGDEESEGEPSGPLGNGGVSAGLEEDEEDKSGQDATDREPIGESHTG